MKIQLRVAELHPEQIERYEQLHREIPRANLEGIYRAGVGKMQIFRHGNLLVMYTEENEASVQPPTPETEAAGQRWRTLTEPLFSQPWADVPLIFALDSESFEGRLE